MLLSPGKMVFNTVGLFDKAIGESRERVRSALSAIGLGLPPEHINVNLAQADLPKEGSHYDLPIALGLMVPMGALPAVAVKGFVATGELSLDGRIGGFPGALPADMAAMSWGLGFICPADCGPEAAGPGLASPDNQGIAAAEFKNHKPQLLPY